MSSKIPTIRPKDLARFLPFLTDSFGKAELEQAGVIIVHEQQGKVTND